MARRVRSPGGYPPPPPAPVGGAGPGAGGDRSLTSRVLEVAVLIVMSVAAVVIWLNFTGGDDGGSGLDAEELESLLITEAEVNEEVPAASAHYRAVTDGSEAVTPVLDFSGVEGQSHRYAQCQELRSLIIPGGSGAEARVAFRNEQSGALVIHTLRPVEKAETSAEDFRRDVGTCYPLFTVRRGGFTLEGIEDRCGLEVDGLGEHAEDFGIELYATTIEGETDTGTDALCGVIVQRGGVLSTVIVTAGSDSNPQEDRARELAETVDERLRQAIDGG